MTKKGAESAKPDATKSHSSAEGIPPCQPPGENFFLADVRIHNPDDPCWDDGFTVFGTWETIERPISAYLAFGPRGRLRIYQGEAARCCLVAGLCEELRYQQEKRAQPNN